MTDIATTQAFQDRMFERIRSQIGDLMTDDDLKKIVDAALQKAFFEPVRVPRQYGSDDIKDPAMVSMVRDLLRARVDSALQTYIAENGERINALLVEQLGKGFHQMVADYWDMKLSSAFFEFRQNLERTGLLR